MLKMNYTNLFVSISYVTFGVFICFIYPNYKIVTSNKLYYFLAILCLILFFFVSWKFLSISLLASLILAIVSKEKKIINSFCFLVGLSLSSFLAYWLHTDRIHLAISSFQSIKVVSVTLILFLILSKRHIFTAYSKIFNYSIYITFALFVCLITFATEIGFESGSFQQWHHWGAYIGQAEVIFSGALPLNDIPLQYGLGPALLATAGCKYNCWIAFYWIVCFATIITTLLIGFIVIKVCKPRSVIETFLFLTIVFFTCLFWTSYQWRIYSPTTFPSVFAIRFLPAIIFLSQLLYIEAAKTKSFYFCIPLHALWMLCLLWSPDAGIQASILWIPYLIHSRISQESNNHKILSMIFIAIELLIVFISGVLIISLVYNQITEEWLNLHEYFRFLFYRPASTEIVNFRGPITFAISCFILWAISFKDKEPHWTKMWLIVLLCFANFTYYLSHPHDIVILVLLPYFSVLLLCIYRWSSNDIYKAISTTLLSSLLGWLTLFSGWQEVYENLRSEIHASQHEFFLEHPKKLIISFNREVTDPLPDESMHSVMRKNQSNDVKYALHYIHTKYKEPVETIDRLWLVDSGEKYSPWNALHGPVNFAALPSTVRRQYLLNIARRLDKGGWILYQNDYEFADEFIADYDSVYTRKDLIKFGTYTAIRYGTKKGLSP